MRFSKIRLRPMCRVIGMRVIKARYTQSPAPCLTFNLHQFRGRYPIPVFRRIGSRVTGFNRRFNPPAIRCRAAQQSATAFVRVSLHAVSANCLVNSSRHSHRTLTSSLTRPLEQRIPPQSSLPTPSTGIRRGSRANRSNLHSRHQSAKSLEEGLEGAMQAGAPAPFSNWRRPHSKAR